MLYSGMAPTIGQNHHKPSCHLLVVKKLASMSCHLMRADLSTVEEKQTNRISSSIFTVCRYFLTPYICHMYLDVNKELRHCTCNSGKLDSESEAFLNTPIDLHLLYVTHFTYIFQVLRILVNFACIFESTREREREKLPKEGQFLVLISGKCRRQLWQH